MADKSFNEEPMVVVVSDALDPRVKRQLASQLQSTMLTISGLEAQMDNLKASENVKQQMDAVKDQSQFDDEKTKDTQQPKPIEDASPQVNQQTTPKPDANASGEDPFADNAGADNQPQPAQPNPPQPATPPTPEPTPNDAAGSSNNNTPATPPNNPTDQGSSVGGADAFADAPQQPGANEPTNPKDAPKPPAQNSQPAPVTAPDPATANTPQPPTPVQPTTPNPAPAPAQQPQGDDGEDPFADGGPSFESFAGMIGLKLESAEKQVDEPKAPPIKRLLLVTGGDQGVDERTSTVVSTIEDPQNAVVVIDLSGVTEVEAKMQFKALTKQLQSRGIMVVDSIDDAIEFLNKVYDEVSGGSPTEQPAT